MRALTTLPLLGLVACGSATTPPPQRPLQAQVAMGAPIAPGQVLVFSAKCAGMEKKCPRTWTPAVDAIVTGGLAFHGYPTLDPSKLRKDEAQRHETTVEKEANSSTQSSSTEKGAAIAGFLPIAAITTSDGTTVSMSSSTEKTVILIGAVLEDLALEDRKALMAAAGAGSLLTTQITVGANWSVWSENQTVEVMIKLASSNDGTMFWSARCAAASGDYPTIDAAIEAAARCAVDAVTVPPPT